jgi:putative membrane protein insertion efficiency factor
MLKSKYSLSQVRRIDGAKSRVLGAESPRPGTRYPTPGSSRSAERLLAWVLDCALALYRAALSPLFGPCCRFVPSCSVYAREAVRQYGLLRGSWMALARILRCHPFHPGGWDPVL